MSSLPPIIAIDGPSASGKGTLARRLAAHFDFAHLDTGLLYRAVGLSVLTHGSDPADAHAAARAAQTLKAQDLTNPALREDRVAIAASKVAAHPEVRALLLKFQQDFCLTPPHGKKGAVLDGRDIGTVIAPDAPVKIYVTASTETRAIRRQKELEGRGEQIDFATLLADMQARDSRDSRRATAPAKPAEDAVLLDTSALTADEAFAEAVQLVNERLA